MDDSSSILIVGAGIAGLTLARLLKRANIPYTIIEKRPAAAVTGAGIALPANAVSALKYMSLGEEISESAHRINEIRYTKASGKLLGSASLLDAPLNTDAFVALHRKKLHEILLCGIEDEIHYNTEIHQLRNSDTAVEVDFNNDTLLETHYAAVIGCDGVNSSVRQQLYPHFNTVDLNVHIWRWVFNHPTNHLQPTYMLDADELLLAYPISNKEVYAYAHVYDPEMKLMLNKDHHTNIRKYFQHFGDIGKIVIDNLPENSMIIPDRLLSVPYPIFGEGRVACVGDAANACSPALQQGAAAAFEDAICLAEFLRFLPVKTSIYHYKRFREKRVNWIITASTKPYASIPKLKSAIARWIRNRMIRKYGPFNVIGWRYLLSENFFDSLEQYKAMIAHRVN